MTKMLSEMKEGEVVRIFDPDRVKTVSGTITRIARNGLRIDQPGCGEVAAKVEILGVWGYPEDEKDIKKLLGGK